MKNETRSDDSRPSRDGIRRVRSSAARLAAVQALYAFDLESAPETLTDADVRTDLVERLVRSFMDGTLGSVALIDVPDPQGIFEPTEERADLAPPDAELFCLLVRGASHQVDHLDRAIQGALSAEWPWERLELVLRAILRVGTYELLERPQTPARVIFKEYVDLAASFYLGAEKGLVNAVLDRIARQHRAQEFA